MEIPLTAEFEARLNLIASKTGRPASQAVQELITAYLEHDVWFREEVQKGLTSLDQGKFLSDDQVKQRIERSLRS
jgi:predicted transcriptional regulator